MGEFAFLTDHIENVGGILFDSFLLFQEFLEYYLGNELYYEPK